MAAMMPSASTANTPYDNDAVDRDLIDPDDGTQAAGRIQHLIYAGGTVCALTCT